MLEQIKSKCLEYIQDYLVNSFLKRINASGKVILAVNTLMSFDAAYILRALLNYYGLAKFLDVVFVFSLFI